MRTPAVLEGLAAGALLLSACAGPASAPESARAAAPARVETPAAPKSPQPPPEPARTEPAAPPAPPEPMAFTVGGRSFAAAAALATQFNGQRRIVVSSQPSTCEELLATPEIFKKGRVSLIVTAPWKTGTHPLTQAEILDDDTRRIETLDLEGGTIEIVAGPDRAGERGTIKLSFRAAGGSAAGTADVLLCE